MVEDEFSKSEEQIIEHATIFEVTMVPCVVEDVASVLFAVRDVTHFNQIKTLRELNDNKSKMLYHVSHEVRTPLNCIISMLELVKS